MVWAAIPDWQEFPLSRLGYGGSCFPKDIRAIMKVGEDAGYEMSVIKAVEEVNNRQKTIIFISSVAFYNGDIKGKTVAVWGLAFKPETDDMRDAPSLTLIKSLLEAGVSVRAYDPAAMQEARKYLDDKIYYATIFTMQPMKPMRDCSDRMEGVPPANWSILRKIMNNLWLSMAATSTTKKISPLMVLNIGE